LQPVATAKTREEKQNQNKYFFWYKPEFKDWIRNRLTKLNRPDLAQRLLGYTKQFNQNYKKWK
jgi:hypothetical protein